MDREHVAPLMWNSSIEFCFLLLFREFSLFTFIPKKFCSVGQIWYLTGPSHSFTWKPDFWVSPNASLGKRYHSSTGSFSFYWCILENGKQYVNFYLGYRKVSWKYTMWEAAIFVVKLPAQIYICWFWDWNLVHESAVLHWKLLTGSCCNW